MRQSCDEPLGNGSFCSGQGSRGMSGISPEDAESVRSNPLSLFPSCSEEWLCMVHVCMCGYMRAQNKNCSSDESKKDLEPRKFTNSPGANVLKEE